MRNSNTSKTWGSTARNSPFRRSSRRSLSTEQLSNKNSRVDTHIDGEAAGECRRQHNNDNSKIKPP
jgi:hypothetical protein